ncbi:hypothetical protein HBA54_11775 [Pelagibius litoralis]|uniref:Sulfotransferase family protein n=2 Tax=Pelagibius litoralis TaxID=374515 RepID=A0A967KBR4_9PROT|nr:hypothetical protein [Pelagibius litoralis]
MNGQEMSTRHDAKVFCIGRNKTGTTSLGAVLKKAGFLLGNQAAGESLIYDWGAGRFDRIVDLCKSAQAFQDIPFSLPKTFEVLDASFPGSRFILSVRKNADEWYGSVIRFHTKIVGKGRVPTPEDLKNFGYRHRGWIWNNMKLVYGIDENTLYDERIYKQHYDQHNEQVIEHFRQRPDDLLVVNLSDEQAECRLGTFLGLSNFEGLLPHLNRTR